MGTQLLWHFSHIQFFSRAFHIPAWKRNGWCCSPLINERAEVIPKVVHAPFQLHALSWAHLWYRHGTLFLRMRGPEFWGEFTRTATTAEWEWLQQTMLYCHPWKTYYWSGEEVLTKQLVASWLSEARKVGSEQVCLSYLPHFALSETHLASCSPPMKTWCFWN